MSVTVCCEGGEISVIKGTDKTIQMTVQKDDVALDLTNAQVVFVLKVDENDADADASVTKKTANLAGGGNEQVEITDAPNGVLKVYLVPTDTASLDGGTYYWGCRVKTSDGKQFGNRAGSCKFVLEVAIVADPI